MGRTVNYPLWNRWNRWFYCNIFCLESVFNHYCTKAYEKDNYKAIYSITVIVSESDFSLYRAFPCGSTIQIAIFFFFPDGYFFVTMFLVVMYCFRKGKQGFHHCKMLHLRSCLHFGSCLFFVCLFVFSSGTEVDRSKLTFHIRFTDLLHGSRHIFCSFILAVCYECVQWWFKLDWNQYCVCVCVCVNTASILSVSWLKTALPCRVTAKSITDDAPCSVDHRWDWLGSVTLPPLFIIFLLAVPDICQDILQLL